MLQGSDSDRPGLAVVLYRGALEDWTISAIFQFLRFFLYPPDLSVVLRNGTGKRRPILPRLSEIHSENRDFGRKIPHFRHRSGAIPQRDLDETRIFQSGLGGATTLAPSEGKSRPRTATVGFLCSNRTKQPIRVFFQLSIIDDACTEVV